MPSRFFICAPIMIIDVADVNALVTGTDIKSTIKPEKFMRVLIMLLLLCKFELKFKNFINLNFVDEYFPFRKNDR